MFWKASCGLLQELPVEAKIDAESFGLSCEGINHFGQVKIHKTKIGEGRWWLLILDPEKEQ